MNKLALAFAVALPLSACTEGGVGDYSAFSDSAASVADTANLAYYPDDQLIVTGQTQFREGNYGKAFTAFKKALEVVPNDPEALLGYAASADMLRRFDQADAAYRKLEPMIGTRSSTATTWATHICCAATSWRRASSS